MARGGLNPFRAFHHVCVREHVSWVHTDETVATEKAKSLSRAGVERVMGFCTDDEYWEFLRSCPEFERMLVRSGITLIKYWFSITDEEQQARLLLRDKLVEAAFDQERGRVVLTLSRDELLFLIKVARENYSFIARSEKEARLALALLSVALYFCHPSGFLALLVSAGVGLLAQGGGPRRLARRRPWSSPSAGRTAR